MSLRVGKTKNNYIVISKTWNGKEYNVIITRSEAVQLLDFLYGEVG